MPMREDCRHYQSRTYDERRGGAGSACSTWRRTRRGAVRRTAPSTSGGSRMPGWTQAKLDEPALEPEPADVPAADAADLLEDAEDIVSAVAPEAIAEAHERERKEERRSGGAAPALVQAQAASAAQSVDGRPVTSRLITMQSPVSFTAEVARSLGGPDWLCRASPRRARAVPASPPPVARRGPVALQPHRRARSRPLRAERFACRRHRLRPALEADAWPESAALLEARRRAFRPRRRRRRRPRVLRAVSCRLRHRGRASAAFLDDARGAARAGPGDRAERRDRQGGARARRLRPSRRRLLARRPRAFGAPLGRVSSIPSSSCTCSARVRPARSPRPSSRAPSSSSAKRPRRP